MKNGDIVDNISSEDWDRDFEFYFVESDANIINNYFEKILSDKRKLILKNIVINKNLLNTKIIKGEEIKNGK